MTDPAATTTALPDQQTTQVERARALRDEFPEWQIRYDPTDARWYGLRAGRSVTAKTSTELRMKLRHQ